MSQSVAPGYRCTSVIFQEPLMRTTHALAAIAAAPHQLVGLAVGPGYLGELDNASIDIGNTLGNKSQPFNGAFADVYTSRSG